MLWNTGKKLEEARQAEGSKATAGACVVLLSVITVCTSLIFLSYLLSL